MKTLLAEKFDEEAVRARALEAGKLDAKWTGLHARAMSMVQPPLSEELIEKILNPPPPRKLQGPPDAPRLEQYQHHRPPAGPREPHDLRSRPNPNRDRMDGDAISAPPPQGAVAFSIEPENLSGIVAPMERTEAELIAAAVNGDAASFEPLVQKYSPRVFATARRYARLEREVEDIAQEVWVKAFQKLGSFRGEAPFEHWLMRLAVRTCYDFLRAH